MPESESVSPEPKGQVDVTRVPRYAGLTTFARLPRIDEVESYDVAVVGVPFDAGTSYRPGARFGPQAVRQGSRLLRPFHAGLDRYPFAAQQVVDAGDLPCNPFDIAKAIEEMEAGARDLITDGARLMAVGGDHTIALPLMRAAVGRSGPVALLHFDAHLDTWDSYWGAEYTHGTPFRRAAEEGLMLDARSVHVGIRGPLYGHSDLEQDAELGFEIVDCMAVATAGVEATVRRIKDRLGDAPVYVSVDVDVMDPAFAPATGTPEAGGLSSRELLAILRGLDGVSIVGADVVEVSPSYDHAEITAIAAANVVYELLGLMAPRRT
jgi:agmatinase